MSHRPENTVKDYPELIADYYLGRKSTRWRPANLDEFRRSVSQDDLLLIPQGKLVLDADAGNGCFSRLVQDAGNKVSLICLEEGMLVEKSFSSPLPEVRAEGTRFVVEWPAGDWYRKGKDTE